MKVAHITATGSKSTIAWPAELSVAEVNQVLLSQALKAYQSNLRQGTSQTKTRSDLNRTKKKWFKQKGTGNARHGARTANIFVGGGVVHGPNGMQNWKQTITQAMKKQSLLHALTAQAQQVFVHDGVEAVKGKTADAVKVLASCTQLTDRVLVITSQNTQEIIRSYNNIANVLVMAAARVTALEVASADAIVVSPAALEALTARVSGKLKPAAKTVEAKATSAVKTEAKAAAKPAAKKAAAKPKAETKTAKTSTKTSKSKTK